MKVIKTFAIAALFAGSATLAFAQNGPGINSAGTNLNSAPPNGTMPGTPATHGQNAPVKNTWARRKANTCRNDADRNTNRIG